MQALRLFCDVARCQSFSRAAAEHGITQSAASQRIGQLERRLGVTLIDRSVRPLALTPAGEVLLREGQELLQRYDDLERKISTLWPKVQGAVTVDAIYSAGIDLLDRVKRSFESQHAGVTVLVQFKQPQEVYEGVRQGACDIGIVSYPDSWRDVGVIPLRDERMAVVCSPTHPLAGRRRVRAADLEGLSMAAFEPQLPVGRRIRKYLKDQGVNPTVSSVFDNIDTIKNAVAVTHQFAILPKRTAMREVHAGTLAAVDLLPVLERPIGIIHRRRRGGGSPFSPAAQAFVDHLLSLAGPHVDLVDQVVAAEPGQALAGDRS